jgi:hypothetical protein
MPKAAIADFVHSWEKMTTNVKADAAELPPHIPLYSDPLADLLEQFKAIGAAKDARRAVKQQEVKDANELRKQAAKAASKLASALIAHFGRDSERLLAYGIIPRRPPKRKPAGANGQPESPESPPPEAQAGSKTVEQPKPEDPAPAPQSNSAASTA